MHQSIRSVPTSNVVSLDRDALVLETIREQSFEVHDTRLDNGLRCLAIPKASPCYASVKIYFDAGSRHEGEGQHGMLHFLEHLNPGAYRLANNGVTLYDLCQRQSWALSVGMGEDSLWYGFESPDFDADLSASALKNILEYPERLLRGVFDVEKNRILEELDRYAYEFGRLQNQTISAILAAGTGYAHALGGNREQVSDYQFDEITSFGRPFLNLKNATLAINAPSTDIAWIQRHFSNLALSNSDFIPPEVHVAPNWDNIAPVTLVPTNLTSGIRVVTLFPFVGDGFSREHRMAEQSEAIVNRVLQESLAYSSGLTYSTTVQQVRYPGSGALVSGFTVHPDKLAPAMNRFLEVIDTLSGHVTDERLHDHYVSLRNAIYGIVAFQDGSTLLEMVARQKLTSIPDLSERLKMIASFSVDEIKEFIAARVAPGLAKFVVFGAAQDLDRLPSIFQP